MVCPNNYILNPKTNRCVLKTGAIGKKLLNTTKECPSDKILNPQSNRCISKTSAKGKTLAICTIPGLNQLSGTCWYNSIFNIFIMSTRTNEYMMKKYKKLSKSDKTLITNMEINPTKCSRTYLKYHYFYKYFLKYSELKHDLKYIDIRRLRNKVDEPKEMIDLMSIRKTPDWNKTSPGYLPHIAIKKLAPILYEPMEFILVDIERDIRESRFPEVITDKSTKFICFYPELLYIKGLERKYDIKSQGFQLESASIGIACTNDDGQLKGHSIAGFTCNNKRYIFDSNYPSVIEFDWADEVALKNYASKAFSFCETLVQITYSIVIYIKC